LQSCFTFDIIYSAVTNVLQSLSLRQSLQPVTIRQMITLTHKDGPGSVLYVQRQWLASRSKPQFHHFRYAAPDPPLGRPTQSGVDVHTARTRYAQCASKRRVSSILWVECTYWWNMITKLYAKYYYIITDPPYKGYPRCTALACPSSERCTESKRLPADQASYTGG